MIEAEIYLDSWVCFDKYALAWQGQITYQQAMDLIPFAEHMIYKLKLSPIVYTETFKITPTNQIKQMIIMADLEWYREGKGYLTDAGYEWELTMLEVI